MRVIVDAQLPPALARWLVERGCDASHVFDLELGSAPDRVIWERALATGAVILTKDEDFAVRAQVASPAPSIVWIRFGNVRTPHLLARLDSVWDDVVNALQRGESLVELV